MDQKQSQNISDFKDKQDHPEREQVFQDRKDVDRRDEFEWRWDENEYQKNDGQFFNSQQVDDAQKGDQGEKSFTFEEKQELQQQKGENVAEQSKVEDKINSVERVALEIEEKASRGERQKQSSEFQEPNNQGENVEAYESQCAEKKQQEQIQEEILKQSEPLILQSKINAIEITDAQLLVSEMTKQNISQILEQILDKVVDRVQQQRTVPILPAKELEVSQEVHKDIETAIVKEDTALKEKEDVLQQSQPSKTEDPVLKPKKKKKKKKKQAEIEQIEKPKIEQVEELKQVNAPTTDSIREYKTQSKDFGQEKELQLKPKAVIDPAFQPNLSSLSVQSAPIEQVPKVSLAAQALPTVLIIKAAQQERIGTILFLFQKYINQYNKIVNSHLAIISNVHFEINRRKISKIDLQNILIDYFTGYAKVSKQFNRISSKFQVEDSEIKNAIVNLKQQMTVGYRELVYLRKAVGNNLYVLGNFIQSHTIPQINKEFQQYNSSISAEQSKQKAGQQNYLSEEKLQKKRVSKLQKLYKKGMEGSKFKEDLFEESANFIRLEKLYRQSLISYGKGVIELRKAYILSENVLFENLQTILNDFKNKSGQIYKHNKVFKTLEQLKKQIKQGVRYDKLCTLTDVDFIRYMFEMHTRCEQKEFTDKLFVEYLEMQFFDKVIGEVSQLLRGTTSKSFPLESRNEELIHTISGNLVAFNRETNQHRDRLSIRYLNAKIISEKVVQFDELIKGTFFDDNKTVRMKLQDSDRAEQLICYLNEKQEELKETK